MLRSVIHTPNNIESLSVISVFSGVFFFLFVEGECKRVERGLTAFRGVVGRATADFLSFSTMQTFFFLSKEPLPSWNYMQTLALKCLDIIKCYF